MKQNIPTVEISPADMALVLTGQKTRHVFRLPPTPTDRLVLTCELHGKRAECIVMVDQQAKISGDQSLKLRLGDYGYPRSARDPQLGQKHAAKRIDREKYAIYRPQYAALAMLADAKRFELKPDYTAVDIQKKKNRTGLMEFTFHRPGLTDGIHPNEAPGMMQKARAAQDLLMPELMATKAFIDHDVVLGKKYGFATKPAFQRAVLRLHEKGLRSEEAILHAFGDSHKPLRIRATQNNHPGPALPEDAFPDGKGHAQILGGASDAITLGTANLLVMGLVRHVLLNNPPPGGDDRTSNYAPPIAMRLSAEGNTSDTGYTNHRVDLPMTLDMMSVRAFDVPYRPANHYTRAEDGMAQEYGFATMTALRQEMGIRPGESRTLYSYRANLTPPEELPFDRDRTGVRLRDMVRSLRSAWEEGNDPSIRRAQEYYDMLPVAAQREGDSRMLGDDISAPLNRNSTRALPADVRAQRTHAPELTVTGKDKPKRNRSEAEERLPLQGEKWQLVRKGKATPAARASLQEQLPPELRDQLSPPASEPPTTWQATISRGHATPQATAANGNKPRMSEAERIAQAAEREAQRLATRRSKQQSFRDLCRPAEDGDLPEFDAFEADRARFRAPPAKGPATTPPAPRKSAVAGKRWELPPSQIDKNDKGRGGR